MRYSILWLMMLSWFIVSEAVALGGDAIFHGGSIRHELLPLESAAGDVLLGHRLYLDQRDTCMDLLGST